MVSPRVTRTSYAVDFLRGTRTSRIACTHPRIMAGYAVRVLLPRVLLWLAVVTARGACPQRILRASLKGATCERRLHRVLPRAISPSCCVLRAQERERKPSPTRVRRCASPINSAPGVRGTPTRMRTAPGCSGASCARALRAWVRGSRHPPRARLLLRPWPRCSPP